jgi:cell division initiation protein
MRLTPLDVRKQEFKKAMRGLDPDEVYAFLSTIADEYEAVLNDNKALRERLLELDDKVQEYRNMEKTLRDTLLTAERATADAKNNARREAELIVKQAEIEAEKGVRDIKDNAMKLRQEVQTLKRERDSYLSRMKMIAQSHMKFLDTAESDFREDDDRLDKVERVVSERVNDTPIAKVYSAPVPPKPAPNENPPRRGPDAPLPRGDVPRLDNKGGDAPTENKSSVTEQTSPPLSELLDKVIERQKSETTDAKGEADHRSNSGTPPRKAPPSGGEWSLERLKGDIAGDSNKDETD